MKMSLIETANGFSKLIETANSFVELDRSGFRDELSGYHKAVSLFHDLCLSIRLAEEAGHSRSDIEVVIEPVWSLHSQSPLVRRTQTWPRGYPGDFETIEYLCEGANSARPGTVGYFIEQAALTCGLTQQHRNKVAWQAFKVLETCLGSREERRVLSIACGGSRDIRSIQTLLRATPVQLLLNDMDEDALSHSVINLPHLAGKLQPVHGNVFSAVRRFRARGPFDLIVAGGLFDYLGDGQITWLLDGLAGCLKVGGRLCFTNIALRNPYREWMDYFTHWKLIERSEADLLNLIAEPSLDYSLEMSISREQTGLTHLVEVTRSA
jgi:extracellular factor (EF) 3-hydroxypalmitic acid methyl ester biosynthesis protein